MHVTTEYRHYHNKSRLDKTHESAAAVCVQNLSTWAEAVEEIRTWPDYFFKDESKRFGTSLGSFKALGAPYAPFKILAEAVFSQTGIRPTSEELRTGKYKNITQNVTVCVAADGNQGRGLAYGAKIFGCRCVDYIHNHVSTGRAEMIERAKEDVRMNGWYFVSSTSWTDFDHGIPQHVMNAHMVVVEEALQAIPALEDITHVFVCGGVGSIAAAVFLGFFTRYSQLRIQESNGGQALEPPRFIVVEPFEADCLYQSAKQGKKLLTWLASDFIAVPDGVAVEGMKELASGFGGDVPVVCGESSAANMGVMLKAASNESLRERLGLNNDSQVVLFGLEGATDPVIYKELVGKSPEQVFDAQQRFSRLYYAFTAMYRE